MTRGCTDSDGILGAEAEPLRTPSSRRPLPSPASRGSQVVRARVARRPREGSSGPLPTPPRAPRNFPDARPPLGAGKRSRGSPGGRGAASPTSPAAHSCQHRCLLRSRATVAPGPDSDRRSPRPPLPSRRPAPPLPSPPRRRAEEGGAGPWGQSLPRAPAAQLKAAERKVPWAGGQGVRASLELVPGEHSPGDPLGRSSGRRLGRGPGPQRPPPSRP